MVRVVAFYSDNPSSNPDESAVFILCYCLKITKVNEKRSEIARSIKIALPLTWMNCV